MKPSTMNRYSHHQGSTTLGIIVGIVLGLIVALGVSLYLATSNMPIKDKAANPGTKQDSLVKTENGLPDPNASLYGKPKDDTGLDGGAPSNAGQNTAQGIPNAPAVKPEDDPIGKIAAIATPSKPVPVAAPAVVAAPTATPAPTPKPTPAATPMPAATAKPAAAVAAGAIAMPPASMPGSGGERFFVQAGAFKELAPAESLKAKLALQGVVMVISPKDTPTGPIHRVRTLPLAAKDANALQAQLKVNGVDTSLVKVQ